MPPDLNSTLPPTPDPETPQAPKKSSFSSLTKRANSVAGVIIMLVVILLAGAGVGYLVATSHPKANTTTTPQVSTLTPDQISKLTDVGTSLGNTNQVLTIGANSLFKSNLSVNGDTTVGGKFSANGTVTLGQLNITGATAATALTVGGDLLVNGAETVQKSLTVFNLLAVNGGLNVSGTASVNALNASSISTRNISISGPLTIGHLVTQGPAPAISGGSVGGGGTVSISGNDTAGTVNINTGSGPTTGVLASITFRASFSSTPHISLTPITSDAAGAAYYVTRAASGFAIHINSPVGGATYGFDYIVAQ